MKSPANIPFPTTIANSATILINELVSTQIPTKTAIATITPTQTPSKVPLAKTIKAVDTPAVIPTIIHDDPFLHCDQMICYTPFSSSLSVPFPKNLKQNVEPTYRYGTTQNGEQIPHDGVEFYNANGSPVLAAEKGIVFFAGDDKTNPQGQFQDFYGNLIILKHDLPGFPEPLYTLYAHLSKIMVKMGETVQSGQQIGEVGASGSAIGSHLHFEVRVGAPSIHHIQNPELFLPLLSDTQQKTGILVGSIFPQPNKKTTQYFVLQKIQNNTFESEHSIYIESYAANIPSNSELKENFVISNLPIGEYRISTFIDDKFYELFFFIKENTLTHIVINIEEE